MKIASLYPLPEKVDSPVPQPPPGEPDLKKNESVHWQYACERAKPLEDLAWRNLLLQAKPLAKLRGLMDQLAATRTQIMQICARMDTFSPSVQDETGRLLMDAVEVGQNIAEEADIDEADLDGALQECADMQQGAGKKRAKIIFESARRRFDPRTGLPDDMSLFAASYEIDRRIREEKKFFFTEEHRAYLQLSGPLHAHFSRFSLLAQQVLEQLPRRALRSKGGKKGQRRG